MRTPGWLTIPKLRWPRLAQVRDAGFDNVSFAQADILNLPYGPESFDHVFVCFVLEHLADPVAALAAARRGLKPGGSITVVEGDHGSAYFHPGSEPARRAVHCLVELQAQAGGDALIGRQLYPLLTRAGFSSVAVSPRMVYVDATRPELVDGFTRKTFTAMVEGVRTQALTQGLIDSAPGTPGFATCIAPRTPTALSATRSSKPPPPGSGHSARVS